jgi:ribokinase
MYDVIAIGSANVDIFLDTKIHEHFFDRKKEVCYPLGAKVRVTGVETFTGGGGTNCAVAFSRLGLKTGYIGKIGKDANGEMIYNELDKEKVNFLGILGEEKTDFSIILDSKHHDDRTILNYKGASTELRYEEVNHSYPAWYYFSSLLGESFETLKKIARTCKDRINVGFNASSYLAEKGVAGLKDILNVTTVFVLNKEEAMLLTKGKNIEDMLVKLRKAGPKITCITDGDKGSYTYDGKLMYYQKPHKIKVVEKTGAGDAYAATLVAGLITGKSIEESLSMALANAESVIAYKGAKNVLLSWDKLKNVSGPKLVKKRIE